jgi:hypothetical protein
VKLRIEKKIILSVLVTIFLVWFLVSQISLQNLKGITTQIKFSHILLGGIFYTTSYFFLALRWKMLIYSKRVSLTQLLPITSLHITMNQIMPVKSGELSYIYLTNKLCSLPVEEGIATLLVARVFDIMILLSFVLLSAMTLWGWHLFSPLELVVVAVFIILLPMLILFPLIQYSEKFYSLLERFSLRGRAKDFGFLNRAVKKVAETIRCLNDIHSQKIYIPLFFITLIIMLLRYATFCTLTMGSKADLALLPSIVVTTAFLLAFTLPIQGIGGFGTAEAGLTLGFISVSINKDLAILSSFSLHLIHIMYFLILGGISYIWIMARGYRRKESNK